MKVDVRAFTLTELLVVIAIIAVLAGLLVGPLVKSLDSGRMTACTNLVAQYGKASAQYSGDNDGMMIDAYNYLSATGGLPQYLTGADHVNETYTRCPNDSYTETMGRLYSMDRIANPSATKPYNGVLYQFAANSDSLRLSIGAIEFTLSCTRRPANTALGYIERWYKVSTLRIPSRHGTWGDFQMQSSTATKAGPIIAPTITSGVLMGNMAFRHNGMNTVMAFADGHTARVTTGLPTINEGHDFDPSVTVEQWGGTANNSPSPGREFEPFWGPASNTYNPTTNSTTGVVTGGRSYGVWRGITIN